MKMSLAKDKDLAKTFVESLGLTDLEPDVADLLFSDLESKVLEIFQVLTLHTITNYRSPKNSCEIPRGTISKLQMSNLPWINSTSMYFHPLYPFLDSLRLPFFNSFFLRKSPRDH